MIVHPPIITLEGDEVCVSAAVEFQKPVKNIPDTLWFKFPTGCQPYVTDRSDGFAAGLLLPAMLLGEDLEIRGVVSQMLLHGMTQIQKIFHIWHPKLLKPIQIHCENIEPQDAGQVQGGVATAFSGGVDSFYTLWSHLPQNQPLVDYQITHCLFAQGFDLSLDDNDNFQSLREQFSQILSQLGIQLITCQTNIQAFTANRMRWVEIYGPALAATALVLGRLLKRYYISSVQPYHLLTPTGSSPVSDHYLSSETMDIVHFGAGKSRVDKLAVLSDWLVARENLRVCTDMHKRHGTSNCSRCDKCLRTMAMLKVAGSFDKFPSFDQTFKALDILRWATKYSADEPWVKQTIHHAVGHGKIGYVPILWIVGLAGWIRRRLIGLIPQWLLIRLKRRFYPPEKNPFSHDYSHR